MITIQNVSKVLKQFGMQDYEIRINGNLIATFKHKREDGLGRALFEASKAVERPKLSNVKSIKSFAN
jgi:hypothetical protein